MLQYVKAYCSYLVDTLQSKDLLCNLVYKYRCLCDYELHNQHWLHKHMDQHIFHFDMQVLLGTLGLSGIHRVYILYRDCLCGQVGIGIWLDDYLQYKKL